jgi:late competence protein required for DNA uptake (superfamily II DNA/RNA helicase)
MPTQTDTTLTIHCPYCIAGIEFRSMIAHNDGRFVCRDCAHTVRPGMPEYRCTCRPCLRLSREKEKMAFVEKSLARC